jgi:hypothetical protein
MLSEFSLYCMPLRPPGPKELLHNENFVTASFNGGNFDILLPLFIVDCIPKEEFDYEEEG